MTIYLQNLKINDLEPSKFDRKLRELYNNNLDETFDNECIHFLKIIKSLEITAKNLVEMFKLIKEKELETIFSLIFISLRIFSCTPVSNCSRELLYPA